VRLYPDDSLHRFKSPLSVASSSLCGFFLLPAMEEILVPFSYTLKSIGDGV
jgi:hypothetical protein